MLCFDVLIIISIDRRGEIEDTERERERERERDRDRDREIEIERERERNTDIHGTRREIDRRPMLMKQKDG